MAIEIQERATGAESELHDRISHVDLLNLWRGDMQILRADIDKRFSEMRRLIGIGFAVIALLIAIATFVR